MLILKFFVFIKNNTCGLIDIGSPRSGIKGGDQRRELPLQHVVIIPLLPLTKM